MPNNKNLVGCVYFFVKDCKSTIKKKHINKIVDNDFFISLKTIYKTPIFLS